jgi:hypothetical protein
MWLNALRLGNEMGRLFHPQEPGGVQAEVADDLSSALIDHGGGVDGADVSRMVLLF